MSEDNHLPNPPAPQSRGLDYYEKDYPYVLPVGDVLSLLNEDHEATLTPLEDAFVRWYLQTGSSTLAFEKLVHPAHPFNSKEHTASKLMARPHIKDTIRKIKKSCPYLRLYQADYIVELLHDEVQYLKFKNRNERFYGTSVKLHHYAVKKSLHEEETTDMELLLRCLEIIQKFQIQFSQVPGMNGNAHGSPGGSSGSQPRDSDSGIDRVIAEATRLINSAKERAD